MRDSELPGTHFVSVALQSLPGGISTYVQNETCRVCRAGTAGYPDV